MWRSIGGARKLYQPTMNGDGGRSWPGSDALQKETRLSSSLRCSVRKGLSIPALASTENQQLADTSASQNDHLLRRNPQNVVLHLDLPAGERRFNVLLELRNRRRAVLAVEAARIVHEDHVAEALVAENGFQL